MVGIITTTKFRTSIVITLMGKKNNKLLDKITQWILEYSKRDLKEKKTEKKYESKLRDKIIERMYFS